MTAISVCSTFSRTVFHLSVQRITILVFYLSYLFIFCLAKIFKTFFFSPGELSFYFSFYSFSIWCLKHLHFQEQNQGNNQPCIIFL